MKTTSMNARKAGLLLLFVALIWGSGFIATEYALQSGLSTPLIMSVRFWIAALALLPFQWRKLKAIPSSALLRSIGAGALLCAAFFAQTYGQAGTSVSNSAFLTATNVVLVPFIVWIFTRKRPAMKIYLLALGTLLGVGILTFRFDGSVISMGPGDGAVLLCAFLFALHIAYLGTVTRGIDTGVLTFLQMATAALLSTLVLFALEPPAIDQIPWAKGAFPVLYLALFSTCLCFFLQTYAQQHIAASNAAILLSTEGLFGSAFSVLLGLEVCTWNMVLGGSLIILCVVLTEVDYSQFKPKKTNREFP